MMTEFNYLMNYSFKKQFGRTAVSKREREREREREKTAESEALHYRIGI